MTTAKQVSDLTTGDRVWVVNPDGIAEVVSIEPHPTRKAEGGCFLIDLLVIDGEEKGCRFTRDHPGVAQVALAVTAKDIGKVRK